MSMVGKLVAVWQCSQCGDVKTMHMPSYWTFYRQHLCYGSIPNHYAADGTGVLVAGIYQPLNDLARSIDELAEQLESERMRTRERIKEELAAWPPAPCDRFTWEERN